MTKAAEILTVFLVSIGCHMLKIYAQSLVSLLFPVQVQNITGIKNVAKNQQRLRPVYIADNFGTWESPKNSTISANKK
jgi:hypothetical protein